MAVHSCLGNFKIEPLLQRKLKADTLHEIENGFPEPIAEPVMVDGGGIGKLDIVVGKRNLLVMGDNAIIGWMLT
ncbi:MAG: hypothetical protein COZ08_04885, partial [Bacteroidetes bacterium CG_4_10_14_3_um_filter_42_6]